MYVFAIRATSAGIVAENNHTFFVSGVVSNIASISSLNPMFSISSASSNTTYSISFNDIARRLIKSIKRPGVATIIDAPLLMSVICFLISVPP